MDGIADLDIDKITKIAHKSRRNSLIDSFSGISASISLGVTAVWKEPIAKYINTSDDMVLLIGLVPSVVYLIFTCLSWRSRANDNRAFMNSIHEIEAAAKKQMSSRK